MALKDWKRDKAIGRERFVRKDGRYVIQIRLDALGCTSNQPYRLDLIDKESTPMPGVGYDYHKKCAKTKSDALKIARKLMRKY